MSSGAPSAVMSPGTANARSPSDSANASARPGSRTLTATPAPRSYNRSAAARPRPRAAPGPMATRPLKSSGTSKLRSPPASVDGVMYGGLGTREYGCRPERRQMRDLRLTGFGRAPNSGRGLLHDESLASERQAAHPPDLSAMP